MDKEEYKSPKLPRDDKGRILPGNGSLNPGGLPKDMRNAQANLHKALKKVEKGKPSTFLEHFIQEAFKDRTMAIALLKKIVPDLKAVEVDAEHRETWNIIMKNFAGMTAPKNEEKKDD